MKTFKEFIVEGIEDDILEPIKKSKKPISVKDIFTYWGGKYPSLRIITTLKVLSNKNKIKQIGDKFTIESLEEAPRLGSVYFTFPSANELDDAIRVVKQFGIKFDTQPSKLILFLKGISDIVIDRITKALKKDKIDFVKEDNNG